MAFNSEDFYKRGMATNPQTREKVEIQLRNVPTMKAILKRVIFIVLQLSLKVYMM